MTIVFKFRLRNHKSLDFHRPLRYFFPRSEISPVFRKVSRRRCFSVLFSFTAGWQVTNEFRHNTTTHSCSNLYRETSVRLRRTPHTSQTAIIANNFTFTGYGRLVRFSGKSSDGSRPSSVLLEKYPLRSRNFGAKLRRDFSPAFSDEKRIRTLFVKRQWTPLHLTIACRRRETEKNNSPHIRKTSCRVHTLGAPARPTSEIGIAHGPRKKIRSVKRPVYKN